MTEKFPIGENLSYKHSIDNISHIEELIIKMTSRTIKVQGIINENPTFELIIDGFERCQLEDDFAKEVVLLLLEDTDPISYLEQDE